MTAKEAMALVWPAQDVEITRRHATWKGKVVGVVNEPCLILEDATGKRITIALSEATAKTGGERRDA